MVAGQVLGASSAIGAGFALSFARALERLPIKCSGLLEPLPPPFHAPDNSADINIGLADINANGGGFRLF